MIAVLLAGFAVAIAAELLHRASKDKVHASIASPEPGAKVNPNFVAVVNVRARKGPYTLAYFVDGKQQKRVTGARTAAANRRVALTAPRPGAHTLRVVASSDGHTTDSTVSVNVRAPGQTTPDPPAAPDKFTRIFYEDFSVPAERGTMGSDTDPEKVIYRGAGGTQWVTYPRSYLDTYNQRPYRSDQVLSVHDGVLDYFLHPVDGQPAGANPSPLITGGQQYVTFGRFSARMKVQNTDLSEYHIAWLLWPKNQGNWNSAESDYPEEDLRPGRNGIVANSFHDGGQVESFKDPSFNIHDWHTYTQDWTPNGRRYYVDGRLIGTTRGTVYTQPQRWQFQIETKGDGAHSGHVLVDWVAVFRLD